MDEERYGDWIVEPTSDTWLVFHRVDGLVEIPCFDHESATELAKSLARNAV